MYTCTVVKETTHQLNTLQQWKRQRSAEYCSERTGHQTGWMMYKQQWHSVDRSTQQCRIVKGLVTDWLNAVQTVTESVDESAQQCRIVKGLVTDWLNATETTMKESVDRSTQHSQIVTGLATDWLKTTAEDKSAKHFTVVKRLETDQLRAILW